MLKKYNIKDFLHKTKLCKLCNGTMNIDISILTKHNEQLSVTHSVHDFEFKDGCLVVTTKIRFNETSMISINCTTHEYCSSNIDINTDSMWFVRSCSCDETSSYSVRSHKFHFNKMVEPITIEKVSLFVQDQSNNHYFVNQLSDNPKTKIISYSTDNVFYLYNLNVLNLSKQELLSKITRYNILS